MLKQTPPPSVERLLAGESVQSADIVLCTDTDIDRMGKYQQQWLVVTKDKVLVASDGQAPQLLVSVSFADATEFRCEGVIGSGLLQARINGIFCDLLRYS